MNLCAEPLFPAVNALKSRLHSISAERRVQIEQLTAALGPPRGVHGLALANVEVKARGAQTDVMDFLAAGVEQNPSLFFDQVAIRQLPGAQVEMEIEGRLVCARG